ncbi:MAG: hypothetical protein K6T80_08575, partial [Firmicutes bacterium]|nr:hypothetical protein [Bacillota bacterium]
APTWKFRRMQPGEMNIDPIEGEFFSTEALGSLADALVREAIQNSLDARAGGERVRVRIAFPQPSAWLDGERRARYLEALWPHLAAEGSGLADLPQRREPLAFVRLRHPDELGQRVVCPADFPHRRIDGNGRQLFQGKAEEIPLKPGHAGQLKCLFRRRQAHPFRRLFCRSIAG